MCNIFTGGSHLSAEHHQCVQLTLQVPGLVNVDFADVRAIMTNAGSSLMGQGRASGKARARDAALAAISSPLLDVGIERATGIVWNITGPSDLTLFEVRRELLNRVCSAQCSSHCLVCAATLQPKRKQLATKVLDVRIKCATGNIT